MNKIALEQNILIIRDTPSMRISSLLDSISKSLGKKFRQAQGRNSLVRSIFCQNRARLAKGDYDDTMPAMWLKIAAYELSRGILELADQRPMPVHELAQLREIPARKPNENSGLGLALEVIGLERASRAAISRSMLALNELLAGHYERELIIAKATELLDKQMVADCYYYIGREACSFLLKRKSDTSFLADYRKLIRLALDLSVDRSVLQKHRSGIYRAATAALKPV